MARLASALRPCLALAALALAPACATGDGMQEKLRDATSAYNRSLRWSDYDRAASYLPPSAQPGFLAHRDEIGEALVIVDYELTRLDLDKESGIAACRAEISWHTDRRLIVETTAVDQLWQWHEGQFVLVDERRSGGTPLAIFAEPEEGAHPYLPGIEAYRAENSIGVDERTQRKRKRQAAAAEAEPAGAQGKTRRRGARRMATREPVVPAGPATPLAMDPPSGPVDRP
jgi:hypothetical protein